MRKGTKVRLAFYPSITGEVVGDAGRMLEHRDAKFGLAPCDRVIVQWDSDGARTTLRTDRLEAI